MGNSLTILFLFMCLNSKIAGVQLTIKLDWKEEIVTANRPKTYEGNLAWTIELIKESSKMTEILEELGVESVNDVEIALIGYDNIDGLNFKYSITKKAL